MTARIPLLVTSDPALIDEVVGLAAAQGMDVHLAPDAQAARVKWEGASVVIVGEDIAPDLVRRNLRRRSRVVIVCRTESDTAWRLGVDLGVEHVVVLPEGHRWLLDWLASSLEAPARNGVVLSVLPATGGAGASSFAATVARCTGASMRTIVIDADPLGGGLDILLGIEDQAGLRWPDLADTRGRLNAGALAGALPEVAGVSVLSWSREGPSALEPAVFDEVLDAAVRGFDAVVIDLPRILDPLVEVALARSSTAAVVATTRVRSVVAAACLLQHVRARTSDVRLVVRADGRGLSADAIERSVGDREACRLPQSQRLPLCADSGDLISLREPYGRACAGFVRSWAIDRERAA